MVTEISRGFYNAKLKQTHYQTHKKCNLKKENMNIQTL